MLYIGCLIIVNGWNINKWVLEISIFELQRVENSISRLCAPAPSELPQPPPNTQIG